MKSETLKVTDFSGGLNNRDPADKLQPNEFQALENYHTDENELAKRPGMVDFLNQPINPQPFVTDAATVGLWHLDDAAAPWTDSGVNAYNLNPTYTGPVTGTGQFPAGSAKGAVFTPSSFSSDSGPIWKAVSKPLDGKNQLTIQGWVNISPTFSGQPVVVNRFGQSFNLSSSGALLWGTCAFAPDGINPGVLINGLKLMRDWDAVNGKDASDPYITFTLATKGASGTVTTVTSPGLASAKFVFVKATYNSATGKMNLFINGNLVATATPNGGGALDDSLATVIAMGAGFNQSYIPAFPDFGGSFVNNIYASAILGNTLYVVGEFTTILGQARSRAAAFDLNSGTLLPWNPNLVGGLCDAIVIANNLVYLGGQFTTVNGGVTRNRAAAFDLINGIATAWDPNCGGAIPNYVTCLEVSATGTIFLGGSFKSVNGATLRNGLAEVDPVFGTATAWNPALNNASVASLKRSGTTLYLGGQFATVNAGATNRNNACAVNTVTGTATAWDPNLNALLNAILIVGAVAYLGGLFTTANGGTARQGLCAVDTANGTLNAWDPNLGGPVIQALALATDGSAIYIGGDFQFLGVTAAPGLAAVDPVSGARKAWNPVLTGGRFGTPIIFGFIISNSKIFFVGNFDTIDGQAHVNFGAWNLPLYNVGNFTLDEWNVESSEVVSFPFSLPRARLMPFTKSDGTNQLVFPAGSDLYFTLGDGTVTKINTVANDYSGAESFSATAYWDGVVLGDVLFLCNGVDSPKCWDGATLRPWGEGTIAMWLYENTVGTTPPNGTYSYAYTFQFGSGNETGLSPLTSITTAATHNITLSFIPLGPPGCTARNIYRKGSDANWYWIRQVADNVTTFLDGAWVAGGTPGPTTDTGGDGITDGTSAGQLRSGSYPQITAVVLATKVPNAQYLALNYERIFAAGMLNEPFYCRWPQLAAPHVYQAGDFATAKGDKGGLLGLAVFQGELQASKGGKATMILRGSDPSNWTEFEYLHNDIGCADHFGYVLHTLARGKDVTDQTMLCFPAGDGHWYRYFGYDFQRISENINGTVKALAQANRSRLDWNEATFADFTAALSAVAGGSASINVNAPIYTVDGLRETAGLVKVVNQLNYIGLWGGTSGSAVPAAFTSGHIIAIAKGPAEGLFYFALDGDPNLWRTTDNFQTMSVANSPAGFAAADRFVEIVYASIGGHDQYFCFSAGTGAGGAVYNYDATNDTWALVNAGPFYWKADVLWQINAEQAGSFNVPLVGNDVRTFYTVGNGGGVRNVFDFKGRRNVYINHAQSALVTFPNANGRLDVETQNAIDSAALAYGADSTQPSGGSTLFLFNVKTKYSSGTRLPWAVGYYGLHDDAAYEALGVNPGHWSSTDTTGGFNVQFTSRETEFYLGAGGTVRPQAFWDIATQLLIFAASDAPDANSNSTSHVYKLTAAGALTSIVSGNCLYALATDGVTCWFTDQTPDTAAGAGFTPRLRSFAMANTAVVTTVAALTGNYLPLRLVYNASNATLYCGGKQYQNAKDSFDYQGFLAKLTTAGVLTALKTFTAKTNVGAFPVELAYQTTSPFSVFSAQANILAPDTEAIDSITAAGVVAQQIAGAFNGATGIRSNLLFVPNSGSAGLNLWADRLYWSNLVAGAGDGYPVQLGVPGAWTVVGTFLSEKKNLGAFTGFDDFRTAFSGNVAFYLSNAVSAGALGTFTQISPNQKITAFPAPAGFAQWEAVMTWVYGGTSLASPSVDFVDIGYLLGTPNLPRITGEHFKGRSYWSVAQAGDTANSLVCVLQKDMTWTTFKGWNVSSFAKFRSQLVGLNNYGLAQLLTGTKDLGAVIRGLAVFGNRMGEPMDKLIKDVLVMLRQWNNSVNPTGNGFIKIVPYQAGVAVPAAAWVAAVPSVPGTPYQQQVRAVPWGGSFVYQWARNFAFAIMTSDDVTGAYVPAVGQQEAISQLELTLEVTDPQYLIPVN